MSAGTCKCCEGELLAVHKSRIVVQNSEQREILTLRFKCKDCGYKSEKLEVGNIAVLKYPTTTTRRTS